MLDYPAGLVIVDPPSYYIQIIGNLRREHAEGRLGICVAVGLSGEDVLYDCLSHRLHQRRER